MYQVLIKSTSMRIPWSLFSCIVLVILFSLSSLDTCNAQDYDAPNEASPPPPDQTNCNGIFVTYNFNGREKIYPHVKNASAQAWAFESMLTIVNQGASVLKTWQVSVGFQYNELLVSADGAVIVDSEGYPYSVGKNGTVFAGYPMADLETAIDTAGDYTKMSAQVGIKGTMFGLPKGNPMPKSLKLSNDGFKCPAAKRHATYMSVCCVKDPRFKANATTKFVARKYGDLSIIYDVLTAYESKYMAQITIDNLNPLGRLDHWNLTWEWMRNEFINTMRGAYTHKKDPAGCIYGPQGQYYQDLDFSTVLNCDKKPIISDLPPEKKDDDQIGKLPYCCRNGTLLPKTMNESEARSIFQLEVFKMPPDLNRTAFTPPQNWKIKGVLNPDYKCGPPVRVSPSEFPDPNGLDAETYAIASWQVTCNITKPKPKENKCCVSYSAYYSDSVVPCSTCACGCEKNTRCNKNAAALPLPPEALLVPFDNRTEKARAWAHLNKQKLPERLPCPDNCGVSINWHVDTDYKSGWTSRITLFNWDDFAFEDWFVSVQMKKAFPGFENVYSFNGTGYRELNNTIFMQGLPGLNYLVGMSNGTHVDDPRIPGKQQSVISFLKKNTPHINVAAGDGFPTKVIFNGEECALPAKLPDRTGFATRSASGGSFTAVFAVILTFLMLADRLY